MKIKQVRSYYENKEDYPCPLTEKLIKAGYQQSKGKDSYISFAKEQGVEVDYRKGEPNQWWHLIKAYCDYKKDGDPFNKQIICGELLFWMAEVANCVDKSKMEKLVYEIIASGTPGNVSNETEPNVTYKRKIWNKKIQDLCYEDITKAVEKSYSTINL